MAIMGQVMAEHLAVKILSTALAVLLFAASAGAESFDSEHYELQTVTVAKGLRSPWGLAFLPGGGMLVTERAGGIRIVAANGQLSPRLTGMPEVYAHGQGGMLDVALDPNFHAYKLIYFSKRLTRNSMFHNNILRGAE
jgi:glucose/arabinose dehydrogenase